MFVESVGIYTIFWKYGRPETDVWPSLLVLLVFGLQGFHVVMVDVHRI